MNQHRSWGKNGGVIRVLLIKVDVKDNLTINIIVTSANFMTIPFKYVYFMNEKISHFIHKINAFLNKETKFIGHFMSQIHKYTCD